MKWLLAVTSCLLFVSNSEQYLFDSNSQQFVTNYGTNNYVSYQVGGVNTTVVISAPHGGTLKPVSLPNRPDNGCYDSVNDECTYVSGCNSSQDKSKCGVLSRVSDQNTQYMAVELADRIKAKLGGTDAVRPHVIRCELHRSKLDGNRDKGEAAFGNAAAELAWKEYHDFIDDAKRAVGGKVLYIDLHGQGSYNWNMIGMLLPSSGQNGINKNVLPNRLAQYSSLMQLHVDSGTSMEELVRGPTSIGGLMQAHYNMVPSPVNKVTGGNRYYAGGYSTRRHTGWEVSGFQVEVYKDIRINTADRQNFADKLADAVKYWLDNYL